MHTTAQRVLDKLSTTATHFRREADGSYRMDNPLRRGSNSRALRLTIADDGEHGVCFDHATKETYTLYQFARELGIETASHDSKLIDEPVESFDSLAAYAARQGVPEGVFAHAGWKLTRHKGRPALVYPVDDTFKRYRYLDGAKPKYMSEHGYTSDVAQWYGLDYAINLALATNQPLVICNGEASTLVAHYYGVAAVCVPGGEKHIPDHLVGQLREAYNGAIRVVFDCDKTGRAVAPHVVEQLQAAGYADVAALDLQGGKGFDLANFCKLHGEGSVVDLQKCKRLGDDTPRLWLEENEIELLAPPTFLIKDVIVDSEVTVVYGLGDTGKTFLVMDMALRVAQYAPIMYVAGEDAHGIRLRKTAWQTFFKRQANGNFRMYPDAIPFSDKERVDDFIAINKRLKTKMIVVDTLSQNAGDADENDATAMRDLFRNCMRVAHECHAAVVIIHHTDKIGTTYRGSSTIKDNTYGFFKVEKEEDDIVLDKVRIKNTQPWDYKRRYRLVSVPVEILVNNTVETHSSAIVAPAPMVTKSDKLSQNQMKILEAVGYIAKGEGYAKTAELMLNTDLRGNNFYKPFNRLLDKAYIERYECRNAKGVVLAEKGRAALLQALRDGSTQPDESEHYDVPLFEVNTDLFSTVSTVVNHSPHVVNSTVEDVNHARLTHTPELTAYDELTAGLREVDRYNGFRDVQGFDTPQNDCQPLQVDTELTAVDVNHSTPPHTPVGGVEGGVKKVELNSGDIPAKRELDWGYLKNCYASQNFGGINTHCALRGAKVGDVLQRLEQEAGVFLPDDTENETA